MCDRKEKLINVVNQLKRHRTLNAENVDLIIPILDKYIEVLLLVDQVNSFINEEKTEQDNLQ